MLILTRGRGQSIHIGNGVVVHLLELREGRARIGIAAPPDVRIMRTELLTRRRRQAPPSPPAEHTEA